MRVNKFIAEVMISQRRQKKSLHTWFRMQDNKRFSALCSSAYNFQAVLKVKHEHTRPDRGKVGDVSNLGPALCLLHDE
jgi:hypothetical protein